MSVICLVVNSSHYFLSNLIVFDLSRHFKCTIGNGKYIEVYLSPRKLLRVPVNAMIFL